MERVTPDYITHLPPNHIFTFGSNLGGKHSKYAAKQAMSWGAKYGQAAGLQGRTYGIPTKDHTVKRILSIPEIKVFVDRYIIDCSKRPDLIFWTTEIGCGASKYKPKDIAPLFENAIQYKNIYLPLRFWRKLGYYENQS